LNRLSSDETQGTRGAGVWGTLEDVKQNSKWDVVAWLEEPLFCLCLLESGADAPRAAGWSSVRPAVTRPPKTGRSDSAPQPLTELPGSPGHARCQNSGKVGNQWGKCRLQQVGRTSLEAGYRAPTGYGNLAPGRTWVWVPPAVKAPAVPSPRV
jgi:hypothetical protein